MIKSYWLRIVILASVFGVLALIVSLILPKKYEAVAQILVDQKPLGLSRAMTSADEAVQDLTDFGRARSITTQVEMLTGAGVVQAAATQVAADNGITITEDSELNPFNLQNRVVVQAAQDSDLITLRVRLSSAKLAEATAAAIFDAFSDQNNRTSRQFGEQAIQRLTAQITDTEKQLKTVNADLEKARAKYHAPSLEVSVQSAASGLAGIKSSRETIAAQAAGAKARVAGFEQALKGVPPTIIAQKNVSRNPMIDALNQQMIVARSERARLLQQYVESAPEVRELDRQIKEISGQQVALLKKDKEVDSSVSSSPNPVYQNLVSSLSQARADARGYQQQLAELERSEAIHHAEEDALPAASRAISDLTLQQQVLNQSYATYTDRLQGLKAAQNGRTSTAILTSPPVAAPDPVSPNIVLNTLIGVVLGLSIGVVSAVSSEGRRRPIRTLGQLNYLSLEPGFRLLPDLVTPLKALDAEPDSSYESLLINFLRAGTPRFNIIVTGSSPGAGSSTTAVNIALAAALKGHAVAIVDHGRKKGISALIQQRRGSVEGFGSNNLIRLVSPADAGSISEAGILVIHDISDAIDAATLVVETPIDEVVLLVSSGVTRSGDFLRAQQVLREAGARLTVVLNRAQEGNYDIVSSENTPALSPVGQ